jgi:hypothetical protein
MYSMHLYEVRARKDHRGVNPGFRCAVIHVYDDAGNVIETHERATCHCCAKSLKSRPVEERS